MEIREITLRVRIVVEPDDGRFHAYCPDFRGLHVDGDTPDDALENAKQAASLYVTSLLKHHEPIPVGLVDSDHRYSLFQFIGRQIKDTLNRKRTRIEDIRAPIEECHAVPA